MKEIHIKPVLNGFIVKVGCQELVFHDIDHLCGELKRYQANPDMVEKEYLARAVNRPETVTVQQALREPRGESRFESGPPIATRTDQSER